MSVITCPDKNPIGYLQERMQKGGHALPVYTVISESGPSHSKKYIMKVSLYNGLEIEAFGHNKKSAKVNAAKIMIDLLNGTKRAPTTQMSQAIDLGLKAFKEGTNVLDDTHFAQNSGSPTTPQHENKILSDDCFVANNASMSKASVAAPITTASKNIPNSKNLIQRPLSSAKTRGWQKGRNNPKYSKYHQRSDHSMNFLNKMRSDFIMASHGPHITPSTRGASQIKPAIGQSSSSDCMSKNSENTTDITQWLAELVFEEVWKAIETKADSVICKLCNLVFINEAKKQKHEQGSNHSRVIRGIEPGKCGYNCFLCWSHYIQPESLLNHIARPNHQAMMAIHGVARIWMEPEPSNPTWDTLHLYRTLRDKEQALKERSMRRRARARGTNYLDTGPNRSSDEEFIENDEDLQEALGHNQKNTKRRKLKRGKDDLSHRQQNQRSYLDDDWRKAREDPHRDLNRKRSGETKDNPPGDIKTEDVSDNDSEAGAEAIWSRNGQSEEGELELSEEEKERVPPRDDRVDRHSGDSWHGDAHADQPPHCQNADVGQKPRGIKDRLGKRPVHREEEIAPNDFQRHQGRQRPRAFEERRHDLYPEAVTHRDDHFRPRDRSRRWREEMAERDHYYHESDRYYDDGCREPRYEDDGYEEADPRWRGHRRSREWVAEHSHEFQDMRAKLTNRRRHKRTEGSSSSRHDRASGSDRRRSNSSSRGKEFVRSRSREYEESRGSRSSQYRNSTSSERTRVNLSPRRSSGSSSKVERRRRKTFIKKEVLEVKKEDSDSDNSNNGDVNEVKRLKLAMLDVLDAEINQLVAVKTEKDAE